MRICLIASLYFHSTISALAQTLPTSQPIYQLGERVFMPPLTSVPFGAPTNAPRFKQIVFGHFVQPVNHRHPFGPLLLSVQDIP